MISLQIIVTSLLVVLDSPHRHLTLALQFHRSYLYDILNLQSKIHLVTYSKRKSYFSTSLYSKDFNADDHGDRLRSQTGIRPSLHPTTINALSRAILLYYQPSRDPNMPMKVSSSSNELEGDNIIITPLQVAISAGKLAWDAIEQRSESQRLAKIGSSTDSTHHLLKEDTFTEDEAQVISGRIVGVVLRMAHLESMLVEQIRKSPWVSKYNEHGMFGVTHVECEPGLRYTPLVSQPLIEDPLLRMCRAECLLALFIHHVEIPGLKKAGVEEIAGGSRIDFIDQERLSVLFKD